MKHPRKSHLVIVLFMLFTTSCAFIPTKPAPDQPGTPVQDTIDKSCEEFNIYADTTGVTVVKADGTSQNRPGKAGSTGGDFSTTATINPDPPSKQTTQVQQIYCGCNGKTYTSATDCTSECHASLACFSNICAPGNETTEVCLTTTAKAHFTLNSKIFVLVWKPSFPISPSCGGMKTEWDQKVLTHEQRHLSDNQSVIDEYNQNWQSGESFTACAPDEASARAKLNQQINARLDEDNAKIVAEMQQKAAAFDAMDHVNPLDCSKCP